MMKALACQFFSEFIIYSFISSYEMGLEKNLKLLTWVGLKLWNSGIVIVKSNFFSSSKIDKLEEGKPLSNSPCVCEVEEY